MVPEKATLRRFVVESTFKCNLRCTMCPRIHCAGAEHHMPMDVYHRIAEYFHVVEAVCLSGWGEPYLNKNIFRMIEIAKSNDCIVDIVTNGTLLTEANMVKTLDAKLDLLMVSIDGLSEATYDSVRIGGSFSALLDNLALLQRHVKTRRSEMETSLAFLIMEDNWHEMEDLVDFAARVGFRQIHLKHFNVICTREHLAKSVLRHLHDNSSLRDFEAKHREIERLVAHVQERGKQEGIDIILGFELPHTQQFKPRYCLAEPLESLYFGPDGRVSVCCYLAREILQVFGASERIREEFVIGNIMENDFAEILENRAYLKFLEETANGSFPHICKSCYLLYGK